MEKNQKVNSIVYKKKVRVPNRNTPGMKTMPGAFSKDIDTRTFARDYFFFFAAVFLTVFFAGFFAGAFFATFFFATILFSIP